MIQYLTYFHLLFVLIFLVRWLFRVLWQPPALPTIIYHGPYYTKMAGFLYLPWIAFGLVYLLPQKGDLMPWSLLISSFFVLLLNQHLRPFLQVKNDRIFIQLDHIRSPMALDLKKLKSIGIRKLDNFERLITFEREDGAPFTYETRYRELQFIEDIEFFAKAWGIPLLSSPFGGSEPGESESGHPPRPST